MHLSLRLELIGFILRFFPLLIHSAMLRLFFLDSSLKVILNHWLIHEILLLFFLFFCLSSLFNSDSSLYIYF